MKNTTKRVWWKASRFYAGRRTFKPGKARETYSHPDANLVYEPITPETPSERRKAIALELSELMKHERLTHELEQCGYGGVVERYTESESAVAAIERAAKRPDLAAYAVTNARRDRVLGMMTVQGLVKYRKEKPTSGGIIERLKQLKLRLFGGLAIVGFWVAADNGAEVGLREDFAVVATDALTNIVPKIIRKRVTSAILAGDIGGKIPDGQTGLGLRKVELEPNRIQRADGVPTGMTMLFTPE